MAKKILLGLTTVTKGEWRNKVKEIDELRLKEVALFPTCLNSKEREELYKLLEKTKLEKIPHVHLRSDMEIEELSYLEKRFGTEVFNVHSASNRFAPKLDYFGFCKKIYVENTPEDVLTENELNKYAGLCIDLSHWESVKLQDSEASQNNKNLVYLTEKYIIGVNHVGAITKEITTFNDPQTGENFSGFDCHFLKDLSELDYIKKYKDYLADIISIELENPLKEQLEAKKYLEKMIEI